MALGGGEREALDGGGGGEPSLAPKLSRTVERPLVAWFNWLLYDGNLGTGFLLSLELFGFCIGNSSSRFFLHRRAEGCLVLLNFRSDTVGLNVIAVFLECSHSGSVLDDGRGSEMFVDL